MGCFSPRSVVGAPGPASPGVRRGLWTSPAAVGRSGAGSSHDTDTTSLRGLVDVPALVDVPTPPAPSPHRSGEPWVEEDYAAIVRACREQEDPTIETVADAVGRSPNAQRARIKVLLPLDLRGGPAHLVPGQLRSALLADDAYDWQAHLMATPPPRPIVEHVHPPDVLTGTSGLEDDELLATARGLAQLACGQPHDPLLQVCADEVLRRGLRDQLEASAVQYARGRVSDFLNQAFHPYAPTDHWAMPYDGPPGPCAHHGPEPYDDGPPEPLYY